MKVQLGPIDLHIGRDWGFSSRYYFRFQFAIKREPYHITLYFLYWYLWIELSPNRL